MMNERIVWLGPRKLLAASRPDSIFDEPEASGSGLYVWAVRVANQYRINYVGIASLSVHARHEEHLQCYLTGRYRIHRAESYAAGRLDLIFDPSCGFQSFLERHIELIQALHRQLEVMDVFFAPLRKEKAVLERLESAIISHLRGRRDSCATFLENLRRSRADFTADEMALVGASCQMFEGWEIDA